jgi:Tat protein secretion system quality control protein TatD with DNase activity
VQTARKVAELRGTELATLAAITIANFENLFPSSKPSGKQ